MGAASGTPVATGNADSATVVCATGDSCEYVVPIVLAEVECSREERSLPVVALRVPAFVGVFPWACDSPIAARGEDGCNTSVAFANSEENEAVDALPVTVFDESA